MESDTSSKSAPADRSGNQPPATMQRLLAYAFNYGFALPSDSERDVAERHAQAKQKATASLPAT